MCKSLRLRSFPNLQVDLGAHACRGEEATLGRRTVTLGSLRAHVVGEVWVPISCLCETKICLREVASKAVSSTVHPSVWLIKKRCLPSVRFRPPSVPCQATPPPSVSYSRLTLCVAPFPPCFLPGGSAQPPAIAQLLGWTLLTPSEALPETEGSSCSFTNSSKPVPPHMSSSPRWPSMSLSRHHLTHNSLASVPSLFRLSSCSQI